MGVTCVADAEVAAPLAVDGSGVYVRRLPQGPGERRLRQAPVAPAGDPVDGVRGDVFPAAAVHGGAGIFARGVEIHDARPAGEFPDDTDRHAGVPVPDEWLGGPSAEFLLAAEIEAMRRGRR